jgi:BirA family biotin operon repressor/biotin-[acetyl-CoA-carboxylase] ligase
MKLLNESIIQHSLQIAAFTRPVHIHVLNSIDSTNQFLKDLPANNQIDVCCAETQTQGRGRFGRSWHSPFGKNIYFSIRHSFNRELSKLSGWSLVVSMAVLAALKHTGIHEDIRIKWPNDLLWQGKKLCGNLIENMGEHHAIITGIGLNVNASSEELNIPDKPGCSLYEITGNRFNRNALIAQLIIQLDNHLHQLFTQGFPSFIPDWQKTDYLYGQQITVSQPSGLFSGTANGVNEAGQLLLIDDEGITHCLSSGETSLYRTSF